MREHPAAFDWRSLSPLAPTEVEPEVKKRPPLTVVIAAGVMVAALVGGGTLATIELVEAFTSASTEPVSSP